jgi:hypothetical protein
MGDHDARVGIAAQVADEGGRAEVHSFKRFCVVDLLEKRELREQRFELGAGELPGDAADAAG